MKGGTLGVSEVVADYLCNSCGACFAACNHAAISYHETVGGYLFPQVNPETCIRCGLCYKVCPGHHFGKTLKNIIPQDPFVGEILSCEVGRAVDNTLFTNAQSGGVATALLTYLFESNQIEAAIVAVMQTNAPPRGEVCLVKNAGELVKAQKSKYTPIPILTAIKHIENVKRGVAVVGLPCHFHGLHNLRDSFPVLAKKSFFKIGLVCDRVMTTAAIDFMVGQATAQPANYFIYRDKNRPSYPGNPVVKKVDGYTVVLRASLRMMSKDFFTPVRCRLCFDKLNVFADVVLGDPHGLPEIDRVHGETLVFTRTAKGKSLVEDAKNDSVVKLRCVDPELAVAGQGVDKKRVDWAAFMHAWKTLGRKCPDYAFSPSKPRTYSRNRELLVHSLALDSFPSRDACLRAANQWLVKQKIRNISMWPIRKIKAGFKRLIQCI